MNFVDLQDSVTKYNDCFEKKNKLKHELKASEQEYRRLFEQNA